MEFDVKIAQSAIWQRLVKPYENEKVGTAYLFSGPRGSGKEALAIEFGALLNSTKETKNNYTQSKGYLLFRGLVHEHLKLVVPLPSPKTIKTNQDILYTLSDKDLAFLNNAIETKAKEPFYKIRMPKATRILIHSIRELRRTLYLKSIASGRKIVLIFDAHTMSMGQGEAGNALLKILEEPPANTTLILVSDHKMNLLPTIISRCQNVDFPPLSDKIIQDQLTEKGLDPETVNFYAGLAQGDMQRALAIAELPLSDLKALINSLVNTVTSKDAKRWREFINSYARLTNSDPDEFKFNFYLLQLWFRAAYRLRSGIPDQLHIPGLLERMETINQKYPRANYAEINLLLERSMAAIARNLYMSLNLTNLLTGINQQLQG